MRAIVLKDKHYQLQDIPTPSPNAGEIIIRVAYAGVNRADLFQLQGKYPVSEKTPYVPGMEVSGEITALGAGVSQFLVGDKVCALVSEGAFAEYVCMPAAHVLPVPQGLDMSEAAALPEACFTAWISLVWQAKLQKGETVLIHGGAGGVGSMAIQMANVLGARVFATAGKPESIALCRELGAEAIDYTGEDFAARVEDATEGKGVDVIFDIVGGDYFSRNLAALAQNGRLCIIAFLKGAKVEANLSPILLKHLTIMGSTLRSRASSEKTKIASELHQHIWPHIGVKNGIKPVISRIFPLSEAEKALAAMDEGLNCGKILLKMEPLSR